MGSCQSASNTIRRSLRMRESPVPADDNGAAPTTKKHSLVDLSTFDGTYKLHEILGTGAFSVVRAAVHRQTNEKVAVKIISKAGLPADDEKDLRKEVDILSKLTHPNIVHLVSFFDEPTQYLIAMEFLEGGELFDRIVKKAYYNEKEARDLAFIMLSAIKYIHDRNIVHRDLKPENLLLKSQSDDADIKLADFGFAIIAEGDNLTEQCGTPGYVAPEILGHRPYGKSVDMWSVGVIIYILLGGYPPFHDENQRNLFKKIQAAKYEFHPDFWSAVSDEAKDLISKLLVLDTKARLTVDQALGHAWIKKSDVELASRNLDTNLGELKKYQANRKFKKAAHTIIATQKFKNLLGAMKQAKKDTDAAEAAEADEGAAASPAVEEVLAPEST